MSNFDPRAELRRRRKKHVFPWLLIAASLGVVLAAGSVVYLISQSGAPKNHNELADHLRKKGLTVHIEATADFGGPGRPVAWFYESQYSLPGPRPPRVCVFLCPDSQNARETAATFGADGWSWGRWAFDGEGDAYSAKMKAATH